MWMLPAAGVPADEAGHDWYGTFSADTPDDTRLTFELLVTTSAELLSDSETLDTASAMDFVNMCRDARAAMATFFGKLTACSPDPLDTSSDVELIVSGVEEGLGDDAIAARYRALGGYTADNL